MMSEDQRSDERDELELFRQEARALGMPGEITPVSVGIAARSAEQLLHQVRSRGGSRDRAAAPFTPSVSRRLRPRLAVRLGAVAAATVAISAVVFAAGQEDHARAAVPPILEYEFADMGAIADAAGVPARGSLLKMSAQAKGQREEVATGTTQYRLTESWYATWEEGKAAELVPSRRDQWLRADGSMRIREAFGEPLNLEGRGLSITAKGKPVDVDNETYPANGRRDPQFVAKLGDDHHKVRAALIEVAGCEDEFVTAPVGECLYFQISSTYLTYVVPPRISAAFWRILADDPNLRSLGTVQDRAGRPGIGISLITEDRPEFRHVLIISPETGQLLGSEEILIKNVPDITFEAPALMSFTAILQSRFTTKDGPSD